MRLIYKYFKEETAAEDIQTVILTVVSAAAAIGVGWWIWNNLKKQTEGQNCDKTTNPFCIE